MNMIREVEQKIVQAFMKSAIDAGYKLTVSLERGYDHDDDSTCVLCSTDMEKLMEMAFAGDECHIFVHKSDMEPVVKGRLQSVGWIQCVMGNDGYDVISDYTTNLDELGLMVEAQKISDNYADF